MKLAIPREVVAGETRVAVVPEQVRRFVRDGLEVVVEAGAGAGAFLDDAAYADAGAAVVEDPAGVLGGADLVVKVAAPTAEAAGRDELELLRPGVVLVAMLNPAVNVELAEALAERGVTSFSMDAIPRITRAQSMDVLSSMSTLAGYRAVLLAAGELGKMMPMMMTAAGTLKPASALVIGAGVAGLQAIATAKRLGAVVKGVDVRPAVKEQVESLGARFVPMEVEHAEAETAGGYAADLGEEFYAKEQKILAPHVREADIVITTALIPGRPAPRLITAAMVEPMRPGSVIVDLAATAGGNCSLTEPGRRVQRHGVTILGPLNLPAQMPVHASWMYSRNMAAFVNELVRDGQVKVDLENEIIRETLITHEGKVVHEAARKALSDRKASS